MRYLAVAFAVLLLGSAPTYYGNVNTAGVPNVSVFYKLAKCDGSTDDSSAFSAAATLAAANGTAVFIPPSSSGCFLNSSPTYIVPFIFSPGSSIVVATGKTVTFSAPVTAPLSKIFNLQGTGRVKFGLGALDGKFYPQWWGAKGDGTTDNATPFQNAADACMSSTSGGMVFVPPGTYNHSAGIDFSFGGDKTRSCSFQGTAGWQEGSGTTLVPAFTTGAIFTINEDPGGGLVFQNFAINRTLHIPTNGADFNLIHSVNVIFRNIMTDTDFDTFQIGTASCNCFNQIWVHQFTAVNVQHDYAKVIGAGGNLKFESDYIGGRSTEHTAGTNQVIEFAQTAADTVDPFDFSHNDIEGFANGIVFFNNHGALSDFTVSDNIFDGMTGPFGSVFFQPTSPSGGIGNGTFSGNWFAGGSVTDVTLEGNIVQGLKFVGNTFQGGSGVAVGIRCCASDLLFTGNKFYNSGTGIDFSTTASSDYSAGITITANTFGGSGKSYGACPSNFGVKIIPDTGYTVKQVLIASNDFACTGMGTPILIDGSTGGSISSVGVFSNNMTGFTTRAISIVGPNVDTVQVSSNNLSPSPAPIAYSNSPTHLTISNNQGYNPTGAQSAPSISTSTVALANPFPFAVNVTITANSGGTTAVAKNGTALFTIAASGFSTIRLGVGETITLTYSSAPTWIWMGE